MYGSGAAGSVFAAYLKKGGADLWLVDRYAAHMEKIANEGLIFRSPAGEERLHGFHTSLTTDDLEIMDIVILMVKATQTDAVMPAVLKCCDEHTVVVSLQNGLGNDETLKKYVNSNRILYGFGTIGTELPGPGVCVSKPESGIIMRFGAAEGKSEAEQAGKKLAEIFNKGGCATSFEDDIRPFVWRKAVSNCGYNTLCSILGINVGVLTENESSRRLLLSVWKECCEVADAAGVPGLWEEMQAELPRLREGFKTYYPSMAQDILIHHRQTEISVLNGAIVRYAHKYNVPVPINESLCRMVECIQENYEKRY